MVPINLLAVVVAAVIAMVLGYIWYGPLFGKPWMRLMSTETMGPGKGSMAKMYVFMTIGALLMAYVLAGAIIFMSAYTNISGIDAAVIAAVMNWVGFVAPVTVNYTLTGGNRSWKLWAINAGYYLVSLLLMAVVLVVWQ